MAASVISVTFAILLAACLLVMYLMDTFQVLLRALSGLANAPVLGAHLGSVVMLLNRAATAVALILIGYMVDTGVPARSMLALYALVAILLASSHGLFLQKKLLFKLVLCACKAIYNKPLDARWIRRALRTIQGRRRHEAQVAIILVCALGLAGFLIPSILAAEQPVYRATLMQTGFIINSAASVLNVLYIERRISMIIHSGDTTRINEVYDTYLSSRAVGYIVGAAPFLLALMI